MCRCIYLIVEDIYSHLIRWKSRWNEDTTREIGVKFIVNRILIHSREQKEAGRADRVELTWLFGKVPSLSMALTWVTLLRIGSPSSTVSCSRSVKSGISSLTSSNIMWTVASDASCCAPLFCGRTRDTCEMYVCTYYVCMFSRVGTSSSTYRTIADSIALTKFLFIFTQDSTQRAIFFNQL